MTLLLTLLACGDDAGDTAATVLPCVDPSVTVTSPAADAVLRVGEAVTLSGSARGRGPFIYLWAIDRDVVARGAEASWTPTAAGEIELVLQAEDSCGQGQARLELVVEDAGAR
jgi:chitodextrinase